MRLSSDNNMTSTSLLSHLLESQLRTETFNLDITSYMKIQTDIFIFRAGFCEIIISLFFGHIANIL